MPVGGKGSLDWSIAPLLLRACMILIRGLAFWTVFIVVLLFLLAGLHDPNKERNPLWEPYTPAARLRGLNQAWSCILLFKLTMARMLLFDFDVLLYCSLFLNLLRLFQYL